MNKFFLLFIIIFLQGCIALGGKKLEVKILDTSATKTAETSTSTTPVNKTNDAIVSSVNIVNHQLVIKGTGFDEISSIKVKGNSFNENFSIESLSSTQIIANGVRAVSMGVGSVFDLVLDSAYGAATFQINFSLCDATLGTKGFDCTAVPNDKDVLSYDATSHKWKPRAISGLSYQGAWDATTSLPATTGVGDYFIVSVANAPYNVGDWIVFNGSGYDRVSNGSAITNVFGRTGAVAATKGDYVLTKMGDVDLTTTPPTTGQYLKYNGTNWVPATVAAETDPTVKVFAQTNLPTCTAGQVLKSDGTAFSCVTDNTGAAAFSGTSNRVVATNGSGALAVTAITDTILGYLSGVTSSVQAQLDAKLNSSTFVDWSASGVQLIDPSHLTLAVGNANKAVVTSGTGAITASSVTATELGYVSGVTSAIQTQLTAKQNALSSGATINGIVYPATAAATLQVPLAPVALTDAVNKQYVDGLGLWTVSGSDVYRLTGNVGIGTIAPSSALEIAGASGSLLKLSPGTGVYTDSAYMSVNNRGSFGWEGARAAVTINDLNTSGVTQFKPIVLDTGGVERVRVSATGLVGIGNNSPTAKLTVTPSGVSSAGVTLTAANAATTFITSASTTLNVGDYLIPTTSTAQARTVTVGGTGTSFTVSPAFSGVVTGETYTVYPAAMNINSGKLFVQGNTGNIGLGTTNPSNTLELGVDGGSTAQTIKLNGIGTSKYLSITANGTYSSIGANYDQNLGFLSTGPSAYITMSTGSPATERMRINSIGNVAIGTGGNPTTGTRLDIAGTGAASSSILIPRDTVANRPTTGVNGMLRYASDTNKFEAYENGAWVNMIASGAPSGSAGGDLSGTYPNPTITGLAATKIGSGTVSNTVFGYLANITSDVQTQINGKEPAITAGTTAQYLRGDKSLSTFASDVLASVLTGLSTATNSVIAATDSVLVSFGKLQAQITAMNSSKLDKTGGTLTIGTISGVPTPTNSDDVANKGYVDGYGQWTKTGSDIYRSSGNVGIGTATPAVKLEVANAIRISGGTNATNVFPSSGHGFEIAYATDLNAWLGGGSGTSVFQSYDRDAAAYRDLTFRSANVLFGGGGATQYMSILSSGRVGIGTNAPAAPLQVNYTNTASSGSSYGISITPTYNQTSTAAATDLLINRTETALGSGAQSFVDFQVAGVSKFSINNAGTVSTGGILKTTVVDNTSGAGSTLYINDRSSSTAVTGVTMSSGTQTNSSGQYVGVSVIPTYNQTSTASATDLLINRTETAVGSGSQRLFDAQVGGSSKFTILNSGNVGIGSASPVVALDIVGNSRIGTYPSTVTTSPGAIANTDTTLTVSSTTGYPSSGHLYVYLASGSSELMSYTGTTATTFTGLTRAAFGSTATSFGAGASIDQCLLCVGVSTSAPRMVVTQTRGVGIGVQPPGWAIANSLYVAGNIYTANVIQAQNALNFGQSTVQLYGNSVNSSADYFKLLTNNTERLRVDGSGNVGIGTNNPGSKLEVNGAIVSTLTDYATGAAVDLSKGNTFTLDSVGGSTITLSNMVHGGSYTLVIVDTTARTYTFSGCTNSYFKPANAATTVGTQSIYTILTVKSGATYNCYITWAAGYQ